MRTATDRLITGFILFTPVYVVSLAATFLLWH